MGHFWGKNSFCLYLSSIIALNKKGCLPQILIYLEICFFSNLLRKTNFLSISEFFSVIVIFLTKKRSFQWISPKILQNNKEAEFSCRWLILRRNSFCLYLSCFTALYKKGCLQLIQIFLWIFPLSNLLCKANSMSISVLLFWWISPKMLQNNRKVQFGGIWHILRRKKVLSI